MKRFVLFTFLIGLFFSAFSQDKQDYIFDEAGYIQIKFDKPSESLFYEICNLFPVENLKNDEIYLRLNKTSFEKFQKYSIDFDQYEELVPSKEDLNILSEINEISRSSWDFYPTYDAYIDMVNQFGIDYPEICEVHEIGTLPSGRKLLALKISDNVEQDEVEPEFFYTSTMHGNETTGWIFMLRLTDLLLSTYGSDDRVTDLINNLEIWINPLANPDGTYHGGNDDVSDARRYNANNVDLNRNYPDGAVDGGPHPDGNEWQPETLAFMAFAESRDIVLSANFHGGIELVNYPWDTWQHLHADTDWWELVSREYADHCHEVAPAGYMDEFDDGVTNGYAWFRAKGGRQDYMTYFQQGREFTVEVSNNKMPPAYQLPDFWNYNEESLFLYMEQLYYGFHGTVKDSLTNEPLLAEIMIEGHDEDSSWVYTSMPHGNFYRMIHEGNYTFKVSAPGYLPREFNIDIVNYETVYKDIKLLPGYIGIDQEFKSLYVNLYPNPADDVLQFTANKPVNEVNIFDISGKKVYHKEMYELSATLDIAHLAPGMYFVHLNGDSDLKVIKTEIR